MYRWLLCSFLFILINGSPSHTTRTIMVAASQSDILLSEARAQRSSCGSPTDNIDECTPGENCTYECSRLHELPPEYDSSCEFIEENCGDEYRLLNYLQFVDCHLGSKLRVCSNYVPASAYDMCQVTIPFLKQC